ncbi:MAG: hypothetical protein LAT63_00815 [Marinobacter sp.]|nr:hypothetical protein [Marinobacter sp.]
MSPTPEPRRALVLGCGGVAGAAWSIAALHNLQQQLGWDPRQASILIGTSAGAVLAAMLGAGVSVDQLLACQQGQTGCDWDHDKDSGPALPPLPALRLTAGDLFLRGLRGEVSGLTALCGLAPRGRFDMAPFRRLVNQLPHSNGWVTHPATWLVTVDSQSGQRIAFGHPEAPAAALADAVCASYGVPGWCPPVMIQGREYLDGGVASPTSADLLLEQPVDEVIILAPMTSQSPDRPWSPITRIERRARRYMTAIVDKEEAALTAAGKRVIRLAPNAEDLKAIGYNMMDPQRRRAVLATALQTTQATLRQQLSRHDSTPNQGMPHT